MYPYIAVYLMHTKSAAYDTGRKKMALTSPEPKKYETERIFLPSKEVIMAFTKEQIKELPNYDDLDKIKAGSFAKKSWLKAGDSLVYIMGIDFHSGTKEWATVYWTWANNFNGYITDHGWASSVKPWEFCGKKSGYAVYSENTQSNAFLVKS